MRFSQLQQDIYQEQGFLVLEKFVEMEDCEALRERVMQMVAEYEPRDDVSIFTNNEQSRHSDPYFLQSGDIIRFFLKKILLTQKEIWFSLR